MYANASRVCELCAPAEAWKSYGCKAAADWKSGIGSNSCGPWLKEAYRLSEKEIDFSVYEKVVFLSKSVGTIEAGFLAEKLEIEPEQIYLTPVPDALPCIKENDTVVIGTADEVYPECKAYCDEHGIKPLYIVGANHSLEVEGKPYESLEILKDVMKFIER